MAHRSGEHPPALPRHRAGQRPEYQVLGPPPQVPRRTEVRIGPLPQPPAPFRVRWYDILAIALIILALAELYARALKGA
jgi:hypothetical protein